MCTCYHDKVFTFAIHTFAMQYMGTENNVRNAVFGWNGDGEIVLWNYYTFINLCKAVRNPL